MGTIFIMCLFGWCLGTTIFLWGMAIKLNTIIKLLNRLPLKPLIHDNTDGLRYGDETKFLDK